MSHGSLGTPLSYGRKIWYTTGRNFAGRNGYGSTAYRVSTAALARFYPAAGHDALPTEIIIIRRLCQRPLWRRTEEDICALTLLRQRHIAAIT